MKWFKKKEDCSTCKFSEDIIRGLREHIVSHPEGTDKIINNLNNQISDLEKHIRDLRKEVETSKYLYHQLKADWHTFMGPFRNIVAMIKREGGVDEYI